MDLLFVSGMCVLGTTSLIAVLLLFFYPRLWPIARVVLVSAAIVLCLTVWLAWRASSGFDLGDAFELIHLVILAGLAALLHGGLFLVLIGAAILEVKRGRND